MKKIRKALVIVLVLVLALGMCACGSDGGSDGTDKKTAAETPAQEQKQDNTAEAPETAAVPEIEETVVVDNELCAITITGIEEDKIWGTELKVRLENRSDSLNLMFSLTDAAVNGVSSTALLAETVAPGKKSNTSITLFNSDFKPEDIGGLTDIELAFRVYNSDDWTADDTANAKIHIYPYGEENAVRFVRESQPDDVVLLDNEAVTVIATGSTDGGLLSGFGLELYLVNKTDRNLMFTADDVSINGYMADPFWANGVGAGHSAFTEMSWLKSSLEENGITDVEDVELTLRIYDSDDWFADDIFNGTLSIKP